jgi:hypothetical protein
MTSGLDTISDCVLYLVIDGGQLHPMASGAVTVLRVDDVPAVIFRIPDDVAVEEPTTTREEYIGLYPMVSHVPGTVDAGPLTQRLGVVAVPSVSSSLDGADLSARIGKPGDHPEVWGEDGDAPTCVG